MARRSRLRLVLVSVLSLLVGVGLMPVTAVAAGGCRASYVVLGQVDSNGSASTDWFNVFGDNFDPTVPATLTFSVPVIPWSIDQSGTIAPPVTTFVMPTKDMASIPTNDTPGAGFKWTFRARDPGVATISVRIFGSGCEASTLVDLSPPATWTADPPLPGERSLNALLLLLAFAGAVVGGWSWLDRRRERALRGPAG